MFFDVFVNDQRVATVGPSDLRHLLINVAVYDGEIPLSANGLSDAIEGQVYFTWLQEDLSESDDIRITRSNETTATEPKQTRNLRRGQKASRADIFCDFCKRGEDEVGKIIQAGDTPFICLGCIEMCSEVAKDMDNN